MTLQQLEYIVAVDAYKQFSVAAEKCFVTQPSLSAMIQKLEDELGVKIFDRSRQPIQATALGRDIIAQARLILHESEQLKQMVKDHTHALNGELRLGIIPTVAPYLLPLFLKDFTAKFGDIRLFITELTTENIVLQLKNGLLDVGLMATPLHDVQLHEEPIFYEEFVVYAPNESPILQKQYVLAEEIDTNRLMLLQEGHCLRAQVINLCALQKTHSTRHITYEAGSLETLKRMVETDSGITILPQLAILHMTEDQMADIRFFKPPAPVREVSLVTHRNWAKKKLVAALQTCIKNVLPAFIQQSKQTQVIGI